MSPHVRNESNNLLHISTGPSKTAATDIIPCDGTLQPLWEAQLHDQGIDFMLNSVNKGSVLFLWDFEIQYITSFKDIFKPTI